MARKALGKGLGALIPDANMKRKGGVQEISVSLLEPGPFQPRGRFSDSALEELADSIVEKGIIEPIIVREVGGGRYQVICGHRRVAAAKKVGLEVVPAVVRNVSDLEAFEIALVENLQREDLNPIEEARAYARLKEEFDLTQEEIAKRIGIDRSTVANRLRLLSLPIEVQGMLEEGVISEGHARALLGVKDKVRLIAIAKEVMRKELSVRDVERIVKGKKRTRTHRGGSYPDIAEEIMAALGTKVQIRAKGGRGKIEIFFYSEEELGRILDIIRNITH